MQDGIEILPTKLIHVQVLPSFLSNTQQACTGLHRLAQACTGLHRLAQANSLSVCTNNNIDLWTVVSSCVDLILLQVLSKQSMLTEVNTTEPQGSCQWDVLAVGLRASCKF